MLASVRSLAKLLANSVFKGLNAGPVGQLPAAAGWSSLIKYWYLTGDDQYNEKVQAALYSQASSTDQVGAVSPRNFYSTGLYQYLRRY